jgi:hypothetical protein
MAIKQENLKVFNNSCNCWSTLLRVTHPFSINFQCQIENQVSNYRLLGASSLLIYKTRPNDDHPRTISARFGLIWFSGFRGEDLNVIFYQNMPNLHNRINRLKENFTEKILWVFL